MQFKRASSQYFCPVHTDLQIKPLGKIEVTIAKIYKTLAPVTGKRGGGVLLMTVNHRPGGERYAWCWICEQFVDAVRVTQHEQVRRYLDRRGVNFRVATGRQRSSAVEEALRESAEG